MIKKKAKKGTVPIKKPKKDTKDGLPKSPTLPTSSPNSLKQYAVSIKYQYLVKAPSSQEAIGLSMDRLLGRKFGQVYFDGMTTSAEETERKPPSFGHIDTFKKAEYTTSEFDEFKDFAVTKKGGDTAYGININRNRTDTKEQDYIHFNTADQL